MTFGENSFDRLSTSSRPGAGNPSCWTSSDRGEGGTQVLANPGGLSTARNQERIRASRPSVNPSSQTIASLGSVATIKASVASPNATAPYQFGHLRGVA